MSRPRILIVDDVPENIELLGHSLAADYEVQFAVSGARALELLGAGRQPDLILLDVMMPDMDGYETCRRIKAMPELAEVPVIFVTAADAEESEARGLSLGAADYLAKPINVALARLRIRNHVARHRLSKNLERALTAARQCLWQWDPVRGRLELDSRFGSPLGYAPGESPALAGWEDIVHPRDLPLLRAAMAEHFNGGAAAFEVDVRIRNKADFFVWTQIHGQVFDRDHRGEPVLVEGVLRDVGARKQAELALAERENRLATLIRSLHDTVIVLDTGGLVVQCHVPEDGPTPALPTAPSGGRETSYLDLLSPEVAARVTEAIGRIFEDGRPVDFVAGQRQEGETGASTVHFKISVGALYADGDLPSGFLLVARDVTLLKEAEERALDAAGHDPLTGLLNRRSLDERLAQALHGAGRRQSAGGVLYLDLDHFKEVNDRYGHEAGDALLREVSVRLAASLRQNDTLARIGGDEFVVIVEDLGADPETAASHLARVAEGVRAALAEPYAFSDLRPGISPSIGTALFFGNGLSPREILRHADEAMYQAKRSGRNRVLHYREPGPAESFFGSGI